MQKMKTIDFEKEIFQTLKNVDENAYSIFKLYSMMNSSHHWTVLQLVWHWYKPSCYFYYWHWRFP